MIEISERVTVPASADDVWRIVSDPVAVVDCIPGAAVTAAPEASVFEGSIAVKFGPMRVAFKGRGELDLDADARTGELVARGDDGRGGTRFKARARFSVSPEGAPDRTVFAIDGEVGLTGRLASVVESGAAVVVGEMTEEFTQALTIRCSPPAPVSEAGKPPEPEPARPALSNRTWLRGLRAALRSLFRSKKSERRAGPETSIEDSARRPVGPRERP
jgi:uncharacterized protein